jgi:hypothetical protein
LIDKIALRSKAILSIKNHIAVIPPPLVRGAVVGGHTQMPKNRAPGGSAHEGGFPISSTYAEILLKTVKYAKIMVYYTTTSIKRLLFTPRADVISE